MDHREVLVRGGEVLDGTGAAAVRADVRVRDGRIVEVGPNLRPDGAESFDASGAVVAPGFIDSHAHTDPQVFWDPAIDPDPLHGVTTMLVGNCSLSLYPVSDATRGDIADLFSYIEDVPRHLFDDCVPWTWTDYAGYRDRGQCHWHRDQPRRTGRTQPDPARRHGCGRVDPGGDRRRAGRHGYPPRAGHGRRGLGSVDVAARRRRPRPCGALAGCRRR